MNKRKVSAILACIMLTSTLAVGCGSSSSSGSSASDSTAAATSAAGADAADSSSVLKDGNVVTLKMMFPAMNSSPADMQEIQDNMNAIIQQTVDAQLELSPIEWASYSDQENLIMSSGEKLDILFAMNNTQDLANRGQIVSITSMLDTYAPDAKATMGDYIKACYFNGELYGLPTFHEYTQQAGLVAVKEIFDETGYTVDDVKTMDDVEKVLQKVQELHPDMYPLVSPESKQGCFEYYDAGIFDSYLTSGVGCYVDNGGKDGVQILNLYSTPEYKELAEKAYEWNQKGYFLPDSTTASLNRQDYFRAGNGFGYFGIIHPGTVTQESSNSGKPVVTIPITQGSLTTNKVNFAQYTIPIQCESPEKALAVLNLLYTNADLQNLFRFGIEGKDYEIKDNEKDIAGYPDGVTADNVGWVNELWVSGNSSIAHVWETDDPDIYKNYLTFNASGVQSPLYGFVFDTSNVKNELSAINNVVEKYKTLIDAGVSDPDTTVDKFNGELEQAGIQKVIDEMQSQADAWLASNK